MVICSVVNGGAVGVGVVRVGGGVGLGVVTKGPGFTGRTNGTVCGIVAYTVRSIIKPK